MSLVLSNWVLCCNKCPARGFAFGYVLDFCGMLHSRDIWSFVRSPFWRNTWEPFINSSLHEIRHLCQVIVTTSLPAPVELPFWIFQNVRCRGCQETSNSMYLVNSLGLGRILKLKAMCYIFCTCYLDNLLALPHCQPTVAEQSQMLIFLLNLKSTFTFWA